MIQGRWMPQTEEEWRLLEDLHVVTRVAAQDGVSKARMASLLAFMASATAQQSAFEETSPRPAQSRQMETEPEGETLEEAMGSTESEGGNGVSCPECNEEIEDLSGSLGNATCPECDEELPDSIVDEVMDDE